MRLWSLHPSFLDSKGLVALWREGLLAQAVLAGNTRGYQNHPQLERFRGTTEPLVTIESYLRDVAVEAEARSYNFDTSRIIDSQTCETLTVADGQLAFEKKHLIRKLEKRDPARIELLHKHTMPDAHPLFQTIAGPIASWERP